MPVRAGGRSGSPVVWRIPPIASPIEPKPGSAARGPVCPKPETCTSTTPGFVGRELVGYDMPHRASVPGLKFSRTTSQPRRDATHRVLPARIAQVDGDRPLVARDRRPPEAATVDAHAVAPHDVADAGRFDLDHVGAEVAEQLPGERAGDERAELEDAHACERRAAGVSDVLVTGGTVGSRARPTRRSHGLRTERPLRCAQGRAGRVRPRHRAPGRADLPRRSARSRAIRTSRRR